MIVKKGEKEIPVEDARQLLLLAEPGIIDKTRYLIKAADGVHTWEVDEFYGDNSADRREWSSTTAWQSNRPIVVKTDVPEVK